MDARALDQAQAEAFAGRFLDVVVNGSSLAMMTSIGHQTGLFDVMASLPPSTSDEIARAAGLNDRYVREWLGAMVTGRIVDYDPSLGIYALPPEHAASLTRAAGPNNLAFFTQYVALMGPIEQQVIDCFRHGGGVPYAAYPRFQELQAAETARVYDATLIDVTLPLAPGLCERLERGIDVLDVDCGSGHAINVMAKTFPRSRFAGFDFSDEGIAVARAAAERLGLANTRFEVKDVAALDKTEQYDLITAFDVIHDLAQPRTVVQAIHDALRPDGIFLMVEIAASSYLHENLDHPLGSTLYTYSTLHCLAVSLAQGGAGLGTVWGEQRARALLADVGFTDVTVKSVPGDILNSYYLARR